MEALLHLWNRAVIFSQDTEIMSTKKKKKVMGHVHTFGKRAWNRCLKVHLCVKSISALLFGTLAPERAVVYVFHSNHGWWNTGTADRRRRCADPAANKMKTSKMSLKQKKLHSPFSLVQFSFFALSLSLFWRVSPLACKALVRQSS